MNERSDHNDRRISQPDGSDGEKGAREAGEVLARRLAEATRDLSRIDERLGAEEAEIAGIVDEGVVSVGLPEELPDFVGSEHEVWSDGQRVLKATLPGAYGRRWGQRRFSIPSEYLERIRLSRHVFAVNWQVLGLNQEAGKSRIVSEQPYFQGCPPNHHEIDEFMSSFGFAVHRHRFGDFWVRKEDEILVFDAEPGNFVRTEEGLIPVDLIIQRVAVDLLEVD